MEHRDGKTAILNACQPYLRILQAYNSDNFRKNNWRSSVFYVLLASMLVVLLPMLAISAIWHLIEVEADLKHVAASLPLILTLLQVEMTFIAMIINNRAIAETFEQVQKVINQRKISIIITICRNNHIILSVIFLISIGCCESTHSVLLYRKVESSHSLFHSYMLKLLLLADVVLFVPSTMFPILYAIFGYPPPNLWPLPVEIQ